MAEEVVEEKPKSSGGKGLMIVLIALIVVLLLAVIGGGYFLYSQGVFSPQEEKAMQEMAKKEESNSKEMYKAAINDLVLNITNAKGREKLMKLSFSVKSTEMKDDVYLYGAFTDWQLKPEFKMKYDFVEEAYFGTATLKQGFYDYLYALDGKDGIEFRPMEGSWYETENDYTVIIYFREFASRNDRVLSVTNFNTTEK